MKIFIYEHVSGGGFADKPISPSVLSEGFGMLRTIIADFKRAGHNVITIIDSRLAEFDPPLEAKIGAKISSYKEVQSAIDSFSQSADATYVIAPETNSALQSLVRTVENAGSNSLNCPSKVIEQVTQKPILYKNLKKLGLLAPQTKTFSCSNRIEDLTKEVQSSLDYPVIFKPVDGVSCGGLSLVNDNTQIAGAVEKIKNESPSDYFVVQEFIKGINASVSLLSTGIEVLPISLNEQYVKIETCVKSSKYEGGSTPLNNPLREKAFAAAEKIVRFYNGLRGYVGVDLILTQKEVTVMEINPRLTTSYIGMSKTMAFNPAEAILKAVLQKQLPPKISSKGYSHYLKVCLPKANATSIKNTYAMNGVVSPPFPIAEGENAYGFVTSQGKTASESAVRLSKIKKALRNEIRGA